jgi:hypothetical protein
MVNTATKLIWTSFREDATKFAGSMQVKAEDILNLPQFTFGMHSRKQGFVPIRGVPNALADFPRRADLQALQREMEGRYGASEDADDEPEGDLAASSPEPPTDQPPAGNELKNGPPDVEII